MSTQDEKSFPLTSRDMELLVAALKSTKEAFTIDYAKFAERSGLKNANSAKAAWHGLKKKLDKLGDEGVIGGAGGPQKRKVGADDEVLPGEDNAQDDEVDAESPKKKSKKATGIKGSEAKAVKSEAVNGEA